MSPQESVPRTSYLIDAEPKLYQLPPDHPALSDKLLDGYPVTAATTKFYEINPHYHPINSCLWSVRLEQPPFSVSPKARPSKRGGYKKWPIAGFTVLGLNTKSEPAIFDRASLCQDGSLLLGACMQHGRVGHRDDCPHRNIRLPLLKHPYQFHSSTIDSPFQLSPFATTSTSTSKSTSTIPSQTPSNNQTQLKSTSISSNNNNKSIRNTALGLSQNQQTTTTETEKLLRHALQKALGELAYSTELRRKIIEKVEEEHPGMINVETMLSWVEVAKVVERKVGKVDVDRYLQDL
ncbi:hypothetical protein M231_04719 [Tremella mesenterica]|uniref:Uncharacterized protein n=1 Tax=Tremella mesenterica TaxID=5217 RepID=A0A4Q1BK92_TREME|nr:hypothetical protein M231_04719 [Tremella mesenterica]